MLNDWTGNRFMKHPYGVDRNLENAYIQLPEPKPEKKEEKKQMTPEEELEYDEKIEKRYQDSIKPPKPEEKATNVQDEYDNNFTLAKDANKSAPPSHDSIAYTLKN